VTPAGVLLGPVSYGLLADGRVGELASILFAADVSYGAFETACGFLADPAILILPLSVSEPLIGVIFAIQIATRILFAQLPHGVCLRFAHGTVNRSIVIFGFVGFATEINLDKTSAVASRDDLANLVSP